MCNKIILEQSKRIMQRSCALIAKGITRGEICYVLDAFLKKHNDGCIMKKIMEDPDFSLEEKETAMRKQIEMDFIEIQYEMLDKKFYISMKENILTKIGNYNLYEQTKQSFMSFEKELYYPCVCGLLPIFEGVVVDSKSVKTYKWESIEENLKKNYKMYFNNNDETNLEEYTIRLMSRMLTETIDFDQIEPKELNRHWLLHGRAERLPTKTDCLKLFNIIELVLDIKHENPLNKKQTTEVNTNDQF